MDVVEELVEVVLELVEVVDELVDVVEVEVEDDVLVELLVEVEVVVVLEEVLVEVVEVRSAPRFSVPSLRETAPIIVEKTAFRASKSSPFLLRKRPERLCTPSNPSIVKTLSPSSAMSF